MAQRVLPALRKRGNLAASRGFALAASRRLLAGASEVRRRRRRWERGRRSHPARARAARPSRRPASRASSGSLQGTEAASALSAVVSGRAEPCSAPTRASVATSSTTATWLLAPFRSRTRVDSIRASNVARAWPTHRDRLVPANHLQRACGLHLELSCSWCCEPAAQMHVAGRRPART